MARIPEEEVERLKREVSLERLVAGSGVELKPHGKDRVGFCPFHDDREPSLVVAPSKNLWHCLGACQAGGSVIDWVMRSEKVSFRRAVEILRDKAGYAPLPVYRRETIQGGRETGVGRREKAEGGGAGDGGRTTDNVSMPFGLGLDDGELLARVVGFYHETLKQSPEALEYLAKRGLGQTGAGSRESLIRRGTGAWRREKTLTFLQLPTPVSGLPATNRLQTPISHLSSVRR